MKFKFLKATFVGLILTVSSFANSGVIQSDFLTIGDELAVYDESTNLTWLDLSLTRGLSYEQAISTYSKFRHATHTEVTTLFTNFFGILETTNEIGSSSKATDFVDVFGPTFAELSLGRFYDDDNISRIAGAYFTFSHVYTPDPGSHWVGIEDEVESSVGIYIVYDGSLTFNEPQPDVSIPEPSTLAIFALGMIGLASRRFKKQS